MEMTMKPRPLIRLIALLASMALIVLGSSSKRPLDSIKSQRSESEATPRPLSDPPAVPFSLGGSNVKPRASANTGDSVLERPFGPIATQTPTTALLPTPTRAAAPIHELEAQVSRLAARQPAVYSISGRVMDINNRPIPNVQLWTGTGHSATTDAAGSFSLTQVAAGTYTLTPVKSKFSFSPTSRSVNVSTSLSGQDFVVVPDIGFRPGRDDYSFNNPGQAQPDCSSLQRTFIGLPIQCSQGLPQQEYLDLFERFQFSFSTGTCTGMAATSLAYFVRLLTPPQNTVTWYLDPDLAWPNIAIFHGRQYSKGVLDHRAEELAHWNTSDPQAISHQVDVVYHQLRLAVQPGNRDPVVVDLVQRGNCDIPTPGHTDTPYRLDESDPLRPKVYLYENYAAGDADRFAQFDFSEPVHRFTYWKWDSAACSALLVIPLSDFIGPDGTIPSSHMPNAQ
jgi:hypothetical protein